MSTLTMHELHELWNLDRLRLDDPQVRAAIRRLIAGSVRLRAAGGDLRVVRFRSLTGDGGTFRGIAAAYGSPYEIGGGRWEQIEPGAFAASLASQGGTLPVFWQHGVLAGSQPWATAPIGLAHATERKDGLHASFELFEGDTPEARAIGRAARGGALDALSLGYFAHDIRTDRTTGGAPLDHILRGEVVEISYVLRGANPGAKLIA